MASLLKPLVDRLLSIEDRLRGVPYFTWGTVRSLNPLTVRFDGETVDIPNVSNTVEGLRVGDRVRCEVQARRATIIGRRAMDTGWVNLALASGWLAVPGHTVRGRIRGGLLLVEGAARRGAGGALTHIASLPPVLRQQLTGANKDTFVGAFSALHTSGARAHGELYLTTTSGVIGTGDYTTIDQYAGWVVPLTFTVSADY